MRKNMAALLSIFGGLIAIVIGIIIIVNASSAKIDAGVNSKDPTKGVKGFIVAPAADNTGAGEYRIARDGIRSDDFESYEDYVEYMKRRVK